MNTATFLGTAGRAFVYKGSGRFETALYTLIVDKLVGVWAGLGALALGGLVGWLAWGGGPGIGWLALILVLPLAWGLAGSRGVASLLMLGYFLGGARGLPAGAVVFFGEDAPVWFGFVLYFLACLLLTLPFVLLWSASARRGVLWLRFVLAVLISVVPPLGIVGWVSPLSVAGVLFPALGWVGALLTLAVLGALVARCWRGLVLLALMAVASNVLIFCLGEAKVPRGWIGVDTSFSRLSSAGSDDASQLLAAMRRVEAVKRFALSVPADSVAVVPETVLGLFDGVAGFSLLDTEKALRARGSRVLVGAEVPMSRGLGGQYMNSVLVLGAKRGEDRFAVQGIPVPVSMWKPWADNGAVADVFGRGNKITVSGVRVGVVVCYEQVLAYSLLWNFFGKTDVLVAVSNIWWARGTSIPAVQRQMVGVFGRLFGVPVVVARNS